MNYVKTTLMPIIAALFLSITLAGCVGPSKPNPATSNSNHKPLMVFLVRHCEKADLSEDAELSAAGRERAIALSRTLRTAKLEHIHSSDFIRTRDTAGPTAAEHGLEVELYDPRNLPSLVQKLHGMGGRHLVVGHSITTPPMVELLGGEPGSTINEAGEFDRLYIVTIGSDGTANSVMIRYGKPYDSKPQ